MTALGQIGPFELAEILGQGGMATVYLAEHPEFGRVALRVIRKHTSKLQTEIVEAERMGAFQHILLSQVGCPCVPKAYPPYEDPEGRYFCVPVEYIDGQTLAHLIESAPLPEAEAVRIAIDVCRNLQCAHNFKADLNNGTVVDHVVHGDIKPANIMIDANNGVRVLDYGISKPILDQKSATRQVFGAACYSSPERLAQKRFDLHTDLWAVGIMLYEMVSGVRPFEGNEVEVRQAFVEGRRPLPLRDVSPGFQAVVHKMLSYQKPRRYQSASELMADLERIQNGGTPNALNEIHEQDDRTVRTSLATLATDTLPESDAGTLTTREPLVATPANKPVRPAARPPSAAPRLVAMFLLGILGVSILTGLYVWWHEYRLGQEARGMVQELSGKPDIALKDWKAYEQLAEESWTSVPTREVARIIKQRYKEYASRAIRDYREGLSRALSGQRRQTAELYLQRAQTLDPADRETQSMLLTVQAYAIPLSTAENGRKAIDLFERAARLNSGSPDPYLGIARFSVYSLRDADRASSALDEAQKRGYVELDRDQALIADGYRYQASDLWKSARRMNCDDVDGGVLKRIQHLLERSIELYKGIPQFGGSQAGLESARLTLADVSNACHESSIWKKIWEHLK